MPQPKPLTQNGEPVPFVFIGDEAFPLSKNLRRPYLRDQLDVSKRTFNYRLSRARRIIEATFGVLHKEFECQVATVDKVIKATYVLHNYLIDKNANYLNKNNSDNLSTNQSLVLYVNNTNNTSPNEG